MHIHIASPTSLSMKPHPPRPTPRKGRQHHQPLGDRGKWGCERRLLLPTERKGNTRQLRIRLSNPDQTADTESFSSGRTPAIFSQASAVRDRPDARYRLPAIFGTALQLRGRTRGWRALLILHRTPGTACMETRCPPICIADETDIDLDLRPRRADRLEATPPTGARDERCP